MSLYTIFVFITRQFQLKPKQDQSQPQTQLKPIKTRTRGELGCVFFPNLDVLKASTYLLLSSFYSLIFLFQGDLPIKKENNNPRIGSSPKSYALNPKATNGEFLFLKTICCLKVNLAQVFPPLLFSPPS